MWMVTTEALAGGRALTCRAASNMSLAGSAGT